MLTISMSMYEIGKFVVYKFTVDLHCIVYSKLLIQVYSTLDSLQQCCYLQVTDQSLHSCTVDSLSSNQSVSYYTFCTAA